MVLRLASRTAVVVKHVPPPVRVDDVAHQPVPHDVGGCEAAELDVVHTQQDVLDHAQARGGAAGRSTCVVSP